MERQSFILGMMTAFCECVAGGSKPLALSPPLSDADYAQVRAQALSLVEAHGLKAYHEKNEDLPEAARCHWIVIYARPEVLDAYLSLRASGKNPKRELDAFAEVLGYTPYRIHTSYDGFHALCQ
ncbi:MAG: hypothetical protein RSA12_00820 [Clostridia bacterium]